LIELPFISKCDGVRGSYPKQRMLLTLEEHLRQLPKAILYSSELICNAETGLSSGGVSDKGTFLAKLLHHATGTDCRVKDCVLLLGECGLARIANLLSRGLHNPDASSRFADSHRDSTVAQYAMPPSEPMRHHRMCIVEDRIK
jgi:hypothetical protein